MAEIFDTYVGVVKETVYGTAVAPTRFYVYNSEDISGVYERIESEGMRTGSRTYREDRFVVSPKGAEGDLEIEVESVGFGFWLEHILGSVTTGTAALGVTPHTGKVATLRGKSFTLQVNRPDTSGNDNIFTYEGGKVTEWELANDTDEFLVCTLSCDFEKETIGAGSGAYAKATPSFGTAPRVFSFLNGSVTIAGTAVRVKDISIKGKNGYDNERYFFGAGGQKLEPLESDMREYEWAMTLEFDSVTQRNRVASATAAGATAAIVATWTSDVAVGGGGVPSLSVNIPVARFDDGTVNVDGAELLEIEVSGRVLQPAASADAIIITYTTADTTP